MMPNFFENTFSRLMFLSVALAKADAHIKPKFVASNTQ